MSKGSDSKNPEEQLNIAAARRVDDDRKRRIQALELQRERILSERTSSPHRRSALALALAEVERLLQELGYSIKL